MALESEPFGLMLCSLQLRWKLQEPSHLDGELEVA